MQQKQRKEMQHRYTINNARAMQQRCSIIDATAMLEQSNRNAAEATQRDAASIHHK
jgi:hypothetical protein